MITPEADAWRLLQGLCAPGESPWILAGGTPAPRRKEKLDAQKVVGLVGVAALAVAAAALPVDELPSFEAGRERILCLTSHRLLVVHVRASPRLLARPDVHVEACGAWLPTEVPRLLEAVGEERVLFVDTVVFTMREPGAGERVVCTMSEGWRDNLAAARALAARLRALVEPPTG